MGGLHSWKRESFGESGAALPGGEIAKLARVAGEGGRNGQVELLRKRVVSSFAGIKEKNGEGDTRIKRKTSYEDIRRLPERAEQSLDGVLEQGRERFSENGSSR